MTNRHSFEIIKIIRDRLALYNLDYPCVIVATKADVNKNRYYNKIDLYLMLYSEVTTNEGYKLSKELCFPFIECSAYTGYNSASFIS